MSESETTDDEVAESVEQAESAPSWADDLAHALHHIGDYGVDVAAIAGLTALGVSGQVEPALAQTLGAMLVSVALGKRYYTNRGSRGASA